MSDRELACLLIVEDVPALAASFATVLSADAKQIRSTGSVKEACRLVQELRPDLVILDVSLLDGTAFDVLGAIQAVEPHPSVVAVSGSVSPEESFRLAQLGVRNFLRKPVTAEALQAAVAAAMQGPPDLLPYLRAMVGRRAVHEVETEVRRTMVREALARASGSRRKAARLLSISRQLLQHILRSDAC
jgi:two-component system, response regulator RegA